MHFEFINSIDNISPQIWDRLSENQGVCLQYSFLSSLEHSQSVSADTGWQPQHLIGYENDEIVAIMPMYQKAHSYGEYVFDFAWADAYRQHQLNYYPKLINAIPFTPVTGNRLMHLPWVNLQDLIHQISQFLIQNLPKCAVSSVHILFPLAKLSELWVAQSFVQRLSVQFQWYNRDYINFDDFLASFTARRRKSVNKERLKVTAQQVTVQRYSGTQITPELMDFFYQCYCETYFKRSGHAGYLNRTFFQLLLQNMPQNLLLVIAYRQQEPIAGAFYLHDQMQLYGRYWGSLVDIDGLHFECCYYQGIEFCIENNIPTFNPGTQGEHKILRGFEPTYCYSNHWLCEPAFQEAVERFTKQETPGIQAYKRNAEQLLPFKNQDSN